MLRFRHRRQWPCRAYSTRSSRRRAPMPKGVYRRTPETCPRLIPRPLFFPVGPSIAYVPLTKGQWALIDLDDAPKVAPYNWHAQWNRCTKSYYANRHNPSIDGVRQTAILMHNVIGKIDERSVDHMAPSRTLDNRRANLRPATTHEQACNRERRRDNSSGFKGVHQVRRDGKWAAQITFRGARTNLGKFLTPEEAHAAYTQAAGRLHGEFARVS